MTHIENLNGERVKNDGSKTISFFTCVQKCLQNSIDTILPMDGIQMTIDWYMANTDWLDTIIIDS